ncbi:hypothetical protein BCR44DRAFT_1425292 [Catenaria anguillulae PL171]|uniref:Uncharacterized protein n=1 Tax=Catenaria anguillulae PL171 TaxID=765915 RepID=A0A1Y2I129_9FUNG|nr:hypothetical protein BCR44DRAFT_1425292 [Catenaria anguillulae PL171]
MVPQLAELATSRVSAPLLVRIVSQGVDAEARDVIVNELFLGMTAHEQDGGGDGKDEEEMNVLDKVLADQQVGIHFAHRALSLVQDPAARAQYGDRLATAMSRMAPHPHAPGYPPQMAMYGAGAGGAPQHLHMMPPYFGGPPPPGARCGPMGMMPPYMMPPGMMGMHPGYMMMPPPGAFGPMPPHMMQPMMGYPGQQQQVGAQSMPPQSQQQQQSAQLASDATDAKES